MREVFFGFTLMVGVVSLILCFWTLAHGNVYGNAFWFGVLGLAGFFVAGVTAHED
jgi:hypothetical protein